MNSPLEIHEVRLRGLHRNLLRTMASSSGSGHRIWFAIGINRGNDYTKSACADRKASLARGTRNMHGPVRAGGLREFPAANSFAPDGSPPPFSGLGLRLRTSASVLEIRLRLRNSAYVFGTPLRIRAHSRLRRAAPSIGVPSSDLRIVSTSSIYPIHPRLHPRLHPPRSDHGGPSLGCAGGTSLLAPCFGPPRRTCLFGEGGT